jgi:SAM-dependent methyltransferase
MRTRRVITRHEAAALDLPARIRIEREITDGKATRCAHERQPDQWDLRTYAQYSPWRQWMFESLGPVRDRAVLDLGCGYHPTPIYLAIAGARPVYACDISPLAVAHIRALAEAQGVADRVVGIVCAGEQLPLRDASVDLVHGEAVLHHLIIPLAAREVWRVMRAGGRAVFKDPLGQNPLFELARDYLRHSAKATDRPMTFEQVQEFGRLFRTCTYRGFGFAAACAAMFGGRRRWPRLTRAADAADRLLLGQFPAVERYCRYVVTCAEK